MSDASGPTPGFLVWRLAMKWSAAVDRTVAPFGLTHAQYSLLASLRGLSVRGARPSQRQLSDHTGLDPIFVSKLIRTLERNGLVARDPHPTDARAVELSLTPTGVEVVDRAVVAVSELLDDLTGPTGGLHGEATQAFAGTVQQLLAVPNPQP